MNPSDLYADALSALTAARACMLSPDWQNAIDQESSDQRLAASRALIQVQQAIIALSNETLSDIASAMQANGIQLSQATKGLQEALDDITKVATVMNSLSALLQVVSKILPLL